MENKIQTVNAAYFGAEMAHSQKIIKRIVFGWAGTVILLAGAIIYNIIF